MHLNVLRIVNLHNDSLYVNSLAMHTSVALSLCTLFLGLKRSFRCVYCKMKHNGHSVK